MTPPTLSLYSILSTDRMVSYYLLGLRYYLFTCVAFPLLFIARHVCPYIPLCCPPPLRSARHGRARSTRPVWVVSSRQVEFNECSERKDIQVVALLRLVINSSGLNLLAPLPLFAWSHLQIAFNLLPIFTSIRCPLLAPRLFPLTGSLLSHPHAALSSSEMPSNCVSRLSAIRS